MKIVYLGSGEFGIPSLDAVLASKHCIELIITQPQKSAGRGRILTPTAVALWAKKNSIPAVETPNSSSPEIISKIKDVQPALIVVIAFGQKICNELINLPPKGTINVHGSLLPQYRGAAPINWAIINGDQETGITVATITEQWDAGKILAQAKTKINPYDAADVLHDRLAKLAAPVLVETINKIEDGTAKYTEQNHNLATCAPKMKKTNGIIDFNAPADSICNKIRGLWPWPGASARYISKQSSRNCRVTFEFAEIIHNAPFADKIPGTIDEQLNVICNSGRIKIVKIKPAGGSLMNFTDFVNGYGVKPGDIFAKIEQ